MCGEYQDLWQCTKVKKGEFLEPISFASLVERNTKFPFNMRFWNMIQWHLSEGCVGPVSGNCVTTV